jgi:hypothetical protein
MPDWMTYGLADFLMFSPRVYFRLIERYNQEVWPLQIVFIAGALVVLIPAITRINRAIAFPALAVAWAFCAWQFLWMRYAVINWAMSYAAAIYLLQTGLLVLWTRLAGRGPPRSPLHLYGGIGLMLFGLLAYPFLSLLSGRLRPDARPDGDSDAWRGAGTLAEALLGATADTASLVRIQRPYPPGDGGCGRLGAVRLHRCDSRAPAAGQTVAITPSPRPSSTRRSGRRRTSRG